MLYLFLQFLVNYLIAGEMLSYIVLTVLTQVTKFVKELLISKSNSTIDDVASIEGSCW